MARERVLLVDDEKDFVEALAERIENRDMTVRIAFCGDEALQNATQYRFDAIIMDLAMPGLDGIQTLALLKEQNPDLQVILLTGHATVQKSVEAMRLGALDFLEKPVDITELVGKIREARTLTDELTAERAEQRMKEIMKKKGW